MKYFSIFSGIGGFEYGIQKAYEDLRSIQQEVSKRPEEQHNIENELGEWECVGYSEVDKYAIQVYEKHFNHRNYGDARKIISRELPDFDLLVGGFPCQSFSIAGKRKGFDDTRGTLFFEIARILKDKRPRYFLLENVKGLLSHDKGKTFQTILEVLTDLGYGVEWQVLNSKNFGVPQNRERVFFIGYIRGTGRPEVFPIRETTNSPIEISEGDNLSKIETLNNPKHYNNRIYSEQGISPTLDTAQGGNRQPFIADYRYDEGLRIRKNNISPTIRAEYKSQDVSKSALVVFPTLGANDARKNYSGQNKKVFEKSKMIRRLTPVECERLQGFPDGWTEGVSDTQRYKTLGNAVTTKVIEFIMREFLKNIEEANNG